MKQSICSNKSKEGFTENLECFRRGFTHINQRWKNRLSRKEIILWEGYLNGDFCLLLIFDGGPKPHGISIAGKRYIGYLNSLFPVFKDGIGNGSNIDSRDDEVVFVDLIEFGDGPQKVVASGITMRLHIIEDEVLNFWEGGLYRRLSDGVFEVFPSFVEREGSKSGFAGSAPESHPDMIEGGPQIVNAIANNEGQGLAQRSEFMKVYNSTTISLYTDGKSVRYGSNNLIKGGFKLVDVAIGPFNL